METDNKNAQYDLVELLMTANTICDSKICKRCSYQGDPLCRLRAGADYLISQNVVILSDKAHEEIQSTLKAYQKLQQQIADGEIARIPTGHWIPIQALLYQNSGAREWVTVKYECSLCGEREEYRFSHCHCGARMDDNSLVEPKYIPVNKHSFTLEEVLAMPNDARLRQSEAIFSSMVNWETSSSGKAHENLD